MLLLNHQTYHFFLECFCLDVGFSSYVPRVDPVRLFGKVRFVCCQSHFAQVWEIYDWDLSKDQIQIGCLFI